MAKKSTSSTEPSKTAAAKKPAKATKVSKAAKPATVKQIKAAAPTRKKRAAKATPSKPAVTAALDPKPVSVKPAISHDDISLRAYFIGERRQKLGWPGDSATDWLQAIEQLEAEALEKPLKKR